ncbi:F-box protein At5g50450-like [Lolium rigidum]|uniref:F-box protein At5g50450-like n=1 Tax=Lolium rigidum TaxID=89674 RepID=UPI001F5C6306|nr:F-box protein At5g50450-like [Lolium rigidum]
MMNTSCTSLLSREEQSKRIRTCPIDEPADDEFAPPPGYDVQDRFALLPDDLLVIILSKVAYGASKPADLANAIMTFSRFRDLCLSPAVLKNASANCIAVSAKNWSVQAKKFLQTCADSGNTGASYLLGMILFYCIGDYEAGANLIADAAIGGNCYALYSLAVIMFNGSGGTREDRNLLAGAGLCSRAASLGHLEALRELGFCLIDGFGLSRSVMNGRRLLLQATAWDLHSSGGTLTCSTCTRTNDPNRHACILTQICLCPRAASVARGSDRAHPFLCDWFAARNIQRGQSPDNGEAIVPQLLLCSNFGCGRRETRCQEFRSCSQCSESFYCSRACQAAHWKSVHRVSCRVLVQADAVVDQENEDDAAEAFDV